MGRQQLLEQLVQGEQLNIWLLLTFFINFNLAEMLISWSTAAWCTRNYTGRDRTATSWNIRGRMIVTCCCTEQLNVFFNISWGNCPVVPRWLRSWGFPSPVRRYRKMPVAIQTIYSDHEVTGNQALMFEYWIQTRHSQGEGRERGELRDTSIFSFSRDLRQIVVNGCHQNHQKPIFTGHLPSLGQNYWAVSAFFEDCKDFWGMIHTECFPGPNPGERRRFAKKYASTWRKPTIKQYASRSRQVSAPDTRRRACLPQKCNLGRKSIFNNTFRFTWPEARNQRHPSSTAHPPFLAFFCSLKVSVLRFLISCIAFLNSANARGRLRNVL